MTRTHKGQQDLRNVEDVKRVGLVVRVSTDRQAMNEEGSLKNQLQRLRAHIEYKRVAGGEQWQEQAVYELRAISGKDSMRSRSSSSCSGTSAPDGSTRCSAPPWTASAAR